MRGRSGAATKLDTQSAVEALNSGETFYLGSFSVQQHNESLYGVLPGQAVDRLGVEKSDDIECFLHEETGAIITIPKREVEDD